MGRGRPIGFGVLAAAGLLLLAGCGGGAEDPSGLSGRIEIDGSSTVYPITEGVAEEFQLLHRGVRITVGVSGTGGGFKRFAAGEIDIANASRPIKEEEVALAKENGVAFKELRAAFDGLSVVVNQENDWADTITVEELKRLWEPGSTITRWNQIRPEWPDEEIHLYGPGTDSGTFDYFTEAIVGEEGASRSDYTASEDDNVLVQGIATDPYALGYFGYAYYAENAEMLKVLAIDAGDGNAVKPSEETIADGSYAPLSRPLFIYVNEKSYEEKPQVKAFVDFYLGEAAAVVVPQTGYVPLRAEEYEEELAKLRSQAVRADGMAR